MHTFCKNLKRLRLAKNLTQEQAAEALGVSTQSVSRWECGTTLPDVTMLPNIARLYCVSIDDLYKATSVAYDNYAQKLGSIYEATRDPEDFLRADQEYRKLLKSGNYTNDDLRLYGILHQYMMQFCIERSTELFDRVLQQGPDADVDVFWWTKRQKISLFSQIGRNAQNIEGCLRAVNNAKDDLNEWLCLILAYSFADNHTEAFRWWQDASAKFPASPLLCSMGGDLYAEAERYNEAFQCWDKALELNDDFTEALYAKGFCYEKMGQLEKACDQWNLLADHLARKGFDSEQQLPRQRAKACKAKLGR